MSTENEAAEAKERNYTHVEFDLMTCPVKGCDAGKDGGPREGTVPGIKRHVKLAHGDEAYAKAKFPAKRSTEGPLAKQSVEELRAAAVTRKIKDADSLSKADLIAALAG